MLDFARFSDLLMRGADTARHDARRIVEELRERGDLSAEEAQAVQEAVDRAASAGRSLFLDVLASPLRRALSALRNLGDIDATPDESPTGADVDERFASLDARIARLESQLGERAARRDG